VKKSIYRVYGVSSKKVDISITIFLIGESGENFGGEKLVRGKTVFFFAENRKSRIPKKKKPKSQKV
jgi:hypothetical protein